MTAARLRGGSQQHHRPIVSRLTILCILSALVITANAHANQDGINPAIRSSQAPPKDIKDSTFQSGNVQDIVKGVASFTKGGQDPLAAAREPPPVSPKEHSGWDAFQVVAGKQSNQAEYQHGTNARHRRRHAQSNIHRRQDSHLKKRNQCSSRGCCTSKRKKGLVDCGMATVILHFKDDPAGPVPVSTEILDPPEHCDYSIVKNCNSENPIPRPTHTITLKTTDSTGQTEYVTEPPRGYCSFNKHNAKTVLIMGSETQELSTAHSTLTVKSPDDPCPRDPAVMVFIPGQSFQAAHDANPLDFLCQQLHEPIVPQRDEVSSTGRTYIMDPVDNTVVYREATETVYLPPKGEGITATVKPEDQRTGSLRTVTDPYRGQIWANLDDHEMVVHVPEGCRAPSTIYTQNAPFRTVTHSERLPHLQTVHVSGTAPASDGPGHSKVLTPKTMTVTHLRTSDCQGVPGTTTVFENGNPFTEKGPVELVHVYVASASSNERPQPVIVTEGAFGPTAYLYVQTIVEYWSQHSLLSVSTWNHITRTAIIDPETASGLTSTVTSAPIPTSTIVGTSTTAGPHALAKVNKRADDSSLPAVDYSPNQEGGHDLVLSYMTLPNGYVRTVQSGAYFSTVTITSTVEGSASHTVSATGTSSPATSSPPPLTISASVSGGTASNTEESSSASPSSSPIGSASVTQQPSSASVSPSASSASASSTEQQSSASPSASPSSASASGSAQPSSASPSSSPTGSASVTQQPSSASASSTEQQSSASPSASPSSASASGSAQPSSASPSSSPSGSASVTQQPSSASASPSASSASASSTEQQSSASPSASPSSVSA
ncbi:hypothetical protein DFQ26_009590, partial [Actinomortierella ambigua]